MSRVRDAPHTVIYDRPMELRRIHHVSINVTDLDAALDFYVDKLGLEVMDNRPELGIDGAWLDAGEQELHLIAVDDFDAPDGQHFAFQVDDIADAIAELGERGVAASTPATMDGICTQAFIKDPTGNLIELNQRL